MSKTIYFDIQNRCHYNFNHSVLFEIYFKFAKVTISESNLGLRSAKPYIISLIPS